MHTKDNIKVEINIYVITMFDTFQQTTTHFVDLQIGGFNSMLYTSIINQSLFVSWNQTPINSIKS